MKPMIHVLLLVVALLSVSRAQASQSQAEPEMQDPGCRALHSLKQMAVNAPWIGVGTGVGGVLAGYAAANQADKILRAEQFAQFMARRKELYLTYEHALSEELAVVIREGYKDRRLWPAAGEAFENSRAATYLHDFLMDSEKAKLFRNRLAQRVGASVADSIMEGMGDLNATLPLKPEVFLGKGLAKINAPNAEEIMSSYLAPRIANKLAYNAFENSAALRAVIEEAGVDAARAAAPAAARCLRGLGTALKGAGWVAGFILEVKFGNVAEAATLEGSFSQNPEELLSFPEGDACYIIAHSSGGHLRQEVIAYEQLAYDSLNPDDRMCHEEAVSESLLSQPTETLASMGPQVSGVNASGGAVASH